MKKRSGAGMALALVVMATALVGCTAMRPAQSKEPDASTAAAVSWGDCPKEVAATSPQLQCAQVPVPLDYDDPEGVEIQIMISRLASPEPDQRRGVLMLNPGGPGESGLSFGKVLVDWKLPASVTNSYDVIGMDTRGIGHSAPISCGFTVDQNFTGAIPPYAVDNAAVAKQAKVAEGVAAQCAANDVDGRMQHVSTVNMARDLDQIRIALDEEKLSYFGVSYGSALGAAYASLFPEHSDRIVLDSNVGDTHLNQDGMRRYGLGAEETFPDFARWAAARHTTYGLGRTPADVRKTYFTLAKALDKGLVPGTNGHAFRLGTFIGIYGESKYPATAQMWKDVLSISKATEQPQPTPRVSPPVEPSAPADQPSPADNSFSVFLAVTCNDVEFSGDVATYQRAVAQDRTRYPVFGAAAANIMPCAFWNWAPAEPPVPIVDEGPQNILILQNRRDPATPYVGGTMLRKKFEQRSRLVSVERSGHGVYLFVGSACADTITSTFLTNGTMPAKDLTC
jgi:pimeloyl-ACP methyl ester carboxylesterase